MATVSGLSVKVTSSVATFTTGINRAKNAAQDLSLSLRRLGSSADEAEEEIDSAGRSAVTTAGMFSVMSASTDGLAFSIGSLSTVLTLSFIPAILTLSTILAPVVAALGGFAAVAGSIVGLGLAGTIGAIMTNGKMLKEELKGISQALGNAFAPMIQTATAVIMIWLDAFEQIIPKLVPAQSVIERLAGNFAQLGVELINLLPALVELGITLATEFLPPFVTFAQNVLPKVPGMVRSLVGVFKDVIPVIMPLVGALQNMAPVLLKFGMNTLRLVVPALVKLANIGTRVMRFVNNLKPGMRDIATRALILAPVLVGLVSSITSVVSALGGLSGILSGLGTVLTVLTGPIGLVIAAIAALGAAWATNFGNIQQSTRNAITRIKTALSGLKPVIKGFKNFLSTILVPALEFVAEVAKKVLTPAIKVIETTFGAVFDGILGILSGSLKLIISVMRAGAQLLAGNWKNALNIVGQAFKDILIGILEFVDKWAPKLRKVIINAAAGAVNAVRQLLNKAPGIDIGKITTEDINNLLGTVGAGATQSNQRRERVIREVKEIQITVDSKDEKFKAFAETQAAQKLEEQATMTEMNSGTR